jgi:hypothetical protein
MRDLLVLDRSHDRTGVSGLTGETNVAPGHEQRMHIQQSNIESDAAATSERHVTAIDRDEEGLICVPCYGILCNSLVKLKKLLSLHSNPEPTEMQCYTPLKAGVTLIRKDKCCTRPQ